MNVTTTDLIAELDRLSRLTAMEAEVARVRTAQARDADVRRELARNARNADRRRADLEQAIRDLGATPDVVGTALSRVATVARAQLLDQAAPVQEALLADLALEHQLRDRAAFARVLAQSAGERRVASLLERVEDAHQAAIDWIGTRLGEVALGGPAALRPTPLQLLAGVGQRLALLPSRMLRGGVNRSAAVADRAGRMVGRRVDRAQELAEAAEESLVAGRDELLRAGEQQASERGAGRSARALRRIRTEAGALDAEELPIPRYDSLNVTQAVNLVRRLDDVDELRAVASYESANRDRRRVMDAVDSRIAELADQAIAR